MCSREGAHSMNHAQLTFYFALSLGIGLPIGIIGMLMWFKRVWPRIRTNAERQGPADVAGIAAMSVFYSSPGLLLFLACSVPAIYFNHLLNSTGIAPKWSGTTEASRKTIRISKSAAATLI